MVSGGTHAFPLMPSWSAQG